MSISFKAIVVLGVQLKDLVKTLPRGRVITKYNPDTGEPYETKSNQTFYRMNGREYTQKELREAFDEIQSEVYQHRYYEAELFPHQHGDQWNIDDMVFGFKMAEASEERQQIDIFDLSHIDKQQIDRLKSYLAKVGYSGELQSLVVLDAY